MDWRLRRAESADAAACSLIAGATFLEAFAGILDGADIVAHVADKSSPANFAVWATDPASDLPVPVEDGDIELKRIYALAPTHGGGLGPALMQRAIEDAQALGCKRVLLGVYGGNARAQRFYAKQGFALVGNRRFKVGATWHDDLVFARAI